MVTKKSSTRRSVSKKSSSRKSRTRRSVSKKSSRKSKSVIPAKGKKTLDAFVKRFPIALKHGWKLEQSYPGDDNSKYSHLYQVAPPNDCPIASWATQFPRTVKWAGMEIDIPQTFWDDDLLINHGN